MQQGFILFWTLIATLILFTIAAYSMDDLRLQQMAATQSESTRYGA